MRSSIYVLFFVLQLFIIGINSGPLPSTEEANDELVKDEKYDVSKYAKDVQDGVKLVGGKGHVDLVISGGDSLYVNVDIKNCFGKVLFCYPGKSGEMTKSAKDLCSEWPGFCGFRLIGADADITLTGDEKYEKKGLKECSNDIKMHYQQTQYCKDFDQGTINDASCNADISPGAPFTIHVEDAGCSVIIKNAAIYYPPTTTLPSTFPQPTLLPGPPNNDTTKGEKTSEASSDWLWIVLAVVFALFVTGIIAGCFLCWYKKWCIFKEKTTEASPPRVRPIVTTTVEKVAVSSKSKSKKQKSKPPKIVVETPSKEPSKKRSPTLSLAPTPPTKSVKKPKEKKGASPGKKSKIPAKKSPALVSFPSSTEEEEKKTKEKKAKTPPPPPAAAEKSNGKKAKHVSPEKKMPKAEKPKTPPPASPGKKEKKTEEVQPSAEPFSTLPIHPPTPPKKSINEDGVVHTNRQPGQKGRYVNSLELPSYSGGVAVPSKFAPPEWRVKKRRF